MAHDVFISYSSKDRPAADAILTGLESRGIACWMAPRDIVPGVPWAESIIDALEDSKVMLLVFSASADASVQIHREVERAVHKNVPVLPLRIENLLPSRTLEYFISSHHWFDAIEPPIEQHMDRLAKSVQALLTKPAKRAGSAAAAPPPSPAPAAPVIATPVAPPAPPTVAATAVASDEFPAVIGNYDVGTRLGHGRFGTVIYTGTHRLMGDAVAIRTFRAGPHDNKAAVRDRFLKETRSLQVQHPNIVHVRDFGEQGDLMYIVTDMLPGVSLGEMLRADGPLPLAKLATFVHELTDATVAVHARKGLISGVHPDIIRVVREDGNERLAISSAGVHTAQDLLSTMNEAALRGQGSASELSYVAPELLTGKAADPRTDVFTIGALAYQMAIGRPPFQANSFPELLGMMLSGSPADVGAERSDLPPPMAAAIMRCIEKDPAKRFDTAADVLTAWDEATQ